MQRFVFVGERPSPRADAIGATWQNGRLCAKNLREALVAAGLDPDHHRYLNLWAVPGIGGRGAKNAHDELAEAMAALNILGLAGGGYRVVALGALVARALTKRGIPHVRLTHPAARGSIRKTERYQAHVREILLGCEATHGQ